MVLLFRRGLLWIDGFILFLNGRLLVVRMVIMFEVVWILDKFIVVIWL